MEVHETPPSGDNKPIRRRERHRAVPLMREVRHFRAEGLEIRSLAKTDEIVVTGSPIVYDTPYTVIDLFGEFEERMSPGVARDAISNGADVRFLFNHDGLPLARSTAGTLSLQDTPEALKFTACLDARQQLANDLAIAIERGDVSQMSCGFIVARDEWDEDMEHRTILSFADLPDISAVSYPASPTTAIEVAQRMALEIPVESRARARKLYADIRAGKVLSQSNADKIVVAAGALKSVLDNAGVDDDDAKADDAKPTTADDVTNTADKKPAGSEDPGVSGMDDGTIGGSIAAGGAPGYQDGTGTRAAEPEAEVREEPTPAESEAEPEPELVPVARSRKSSSALRLQIEARKRRRQSV